MTAAIPPFKLIVSIWLAILSFCFHSLRTSVSQYIINSSNRQVHNLAPDSNTVQHFHGPVNIHNHYTRHYPEQLDSFVWTGYLLGALLLGLVLGYGFKPALDPSVKPENERACHSVGRTSPIASGRLLCLDAPSEPGTSSSSAPNATSARNQRGKRLPSGHSSPPPPRTPCEIKESYAAPSGKDRMPSLTMVISGSQFEDKGDSEGYDPLSMSGSRALSPSIVRARASLVQASLPTNTNDRHQKRTKPKPKARLIQVPRLDPVDPEVHRPHRGSTPNTVETRPVERKPSLKDTLFGNPRVILEPIVWFILIVAVDSPGSDLQDPVHDLGFWEKMLKDPALASESIHSIVLASEDATPEKIKEGLAQLYREAGALGTDVFPNLVVYLTGAGDADRNSMQLLGGRFISEEDINQWLWELRTDFGCAMPITLVLDICRLNKDKPSAQMHRGVGLIYSASLGEKAHALRFKAEQNAPYSSFMLAFVIASSVSPASTSAEFVVAIEQRLNQLTGFIRSYALNHDDEDPGHQQPDWSQAGDLSPFLRLARMLSRTTVVREAHKFITQMSHFREEDIASGSTPEYSPSPTDRTTHHLRGTSTRLPVMGS
ncbi:unnamed protein product [Rhizoctonia solani]|uniref:Uncharacterized protein n=1 Tax=Rhizoctonia solani TaxID=456999 RepID=A0A8H3HBN4_9AGAM|nr:unnamed protein product [Rhizoctonia solani]